MKKLITILFLFVSALTYAEQKPLNPNSPTNEQKIDLLEKQVYNLEYNVKENNDNIKEYKENVSFMIGWIGVLATIFTISNIFVPIILTRRREQNVNNQIKELNDQILDVGEKVKSIEKSEKRVKEVEGIVTKAEQEAKASAQESLINKLFTEASNEKDNQKKIDLYSQIIELDPNNISAYDERGNLYSYLKDYDKALLDYNKKIELAPNESIFYNERYFFNIFYEKYDKALIDSNKLIELKPNFRNYFNRAILYDCFLKDYDKAILDYNKLIELDPKAWDIYYKRGLAFQELAKIIPEKEQEYNEQAKKNIDIAIKNGFDPKSI
ncbi:MAG: tetratricopeptide repeat protein [Bacteroidetes bacterium]|nr:tetratricopeptide repeat protein [Bacteroidota bacterium]